MDLFDDLPSPSVGDHGLLDVSSKKAQLKRKPSLDDEDDHHGETKKSRIALGLASFVADRKGEREEMQDSHLQIDDCSHLLSDLHSSIERVSVYAVFDGHGGARASTFASQYLKRHLQDLFPHGDVYLVEREMKKSVVDIFKKMDEEFIQEATKHKPPWKDGTTAVVVLVLNDTLYVANLGDSKAVLCRYKPDEEKHVSIPLTADHCPSNYSERVRIQRAGGSVRDGRVMGVLEVSRSIGDGPYKNHGVTCLPDVKRCQLTSNDRFLMIACDGLWKSFTMDDSIAFVNKVLQDDTIQGTGRLPAEAERLEAACSRLANSAVLRLSGDNVTVLMVQVKPLS